MAKTNFETITTGSLALLIVALIATFALAADEQPPTAVIVLDENYPINNNVILQCNIQEPVPVNYIWNFGDGNQMQTSTNRVFHTYLQNGQYIATCQAADQIQNSPSQPLEVSITEAIQPNEENYIDQKASLYSTQVTVSQTNRDVYTATCNTFGFKADHFRWIFGSGEIATEYEITTTSPNINFTFPAEGFSWVTCDAYLVNRTPYQVSPAQYDNYCEYKEGNCRYNRGYPEAYNTAVLNVVFS